MNYMYQTKGKTKAALIDQVEILKSMRNEELIQIYKLREQLKSQEEIISHYTSAPVVYLRARGGWWCVSNRPTGKGSEKKAGMYIRVHDQPDFKR